MDASRDVLIAGASGLIGSHLLQGLLADPSVALVHSLGRRTLDVVHPKLVQHTVDFAALPILPRVTDVFIALGTTIKVARTTRAFEAIDLHAVVAVAKAAKAAGATRLAVVSALSADRQSKVYYSRVKGEMEAAVSQLGFDSLVLARPSVLAGDRKRLGQPERYGEKLALAVSRRLSLLMPIDYRSVDAANVARGMLAAMTQPQRGVRVMKSREFQALKP